jgi:hypothetical protein
MKNKKIACSHFSEEIKNKNFNMLYNFFIQLKLTCASFTIENIFENM